MSESMWVKGNYLQHIYYKTISTNINVVKEYLAIDVSEKVFHSLLPITAYRSDLCVK